MIAVSEKTQLNEPQFPALKEPPVQKEKDI